MQSFIKVIKDMNDLFGETWKDKMPSWMAALHYECS
jgi:hypothetical protein